MEGIFRTYHPNVLDLPGIAVPRRFGRSWTSIARPRVFRLAMRAARLAAVVAALLNFLLRANDSPSTSILRLGAKVDLRYPESVGQMPQENPFQRQHYGALSRKLQKKN